MTNGKSFDPGSISIQLIKQTTIKTFYILVHIQSIGILSIIKISWMTGKLGIWQKYQGVTMLATATPWYGEYWVNFQYSIFFLVQ